MVTESTREKGYRREIKIHFNFSDVEPVQFVHT